ncbi:hypothetical protein Aab01nite_80920 [Paractinoplanes abujensis]|nr:hypothetical protein Aab01nite_80920 [Actinoplanes abujensis]
MGCFPLAVFLPTTAMTVAMLSIPFAAWTQQGLGGAQLIAELVLVVHGSYRSSARRSVIATVAAATVPPAGLVVFAGQEPWEFVFFGVFVTLAWALGALLRREQTRSRQLAELAAELAAERQARERAIVDEERARISRELHDAVAHTVSVMTMQAGVLRRRLSDRPVERDALAQVEELGRRSVQEIRRVVGLLRPDDADGLGPAPALHRLGDLVGQVRAAGLDVQLTVSGDQVEVPPSMDTSAYRVVQEGLTNVLRHAGAAHATVTVVYAPDALSVTVSDDGNGPSERTRAGHGLVGMRERVGLFGGQLRAGPRDGGGFEVTASFPLPAEVAR